MAVLTGGNTWIQVDARDVTAMMKKVATVIGARSIGYWLRQHVDKPIVRKSFVDAFTKESSPSGKKWKELAEKTVIDRVRKGFGGISPILRRDNKLYDLVTNTPGRIEKGGYIMSWGKDIEDEPKYKYNQTGSKDGKLPARPMIEWSSRTKSNVLSSLDKWVKTRTV